MVLMSSSPPSGRVPEQGPDWFLVATEACGGGTPDLRYFLGNDSYVHENMMLPKLDTFVLLTNEGPVIDKWDEHWSKTKHGDDACARGSRTEFQVMISGL